MSILLETAIWTLIMMCMIVLMLALAVLIIFTLFQAHEQGDEYTGRKGRWKLKRAA